MFTNTLRGFKRAITGAFDPEGTDTVLTMNLSAASEAALPVNDGSVPMVPDATTQHIILHDVPVTGVKHGFSLDNALRILIRPAPAKNWEWDAPKHVIRDGIIAPGHKYLADLHTFPDGKTGFTRTFLNIRSWSPSAPGDPARSAALAHIRTYLRLRPETTCPDLFVQNNGQPLTYDGARNIWRRIQKRSGVKRLGSHLVRYTVAQNAARRGATVADIQGILGHESDKMSRHYIGDARKAPEADTMAKYSMAAA